ncbi:MAG: YceD family protein [Actinocatenispora sp.]
MSDSKTHPHPNPRSPLVLNTRELPRRPGEMRPVVRDVPAPADLGLPLIGVPEGSVLSLNLRMESASEGVFVSGTVTASVEGQCGRCLRPLDDAVEARIQELFAYPGSTTEETTDADEVSRLQDELADIEPAVRDAIVLDLPNTPLCRPDCPGLCPDCGVPLDELPADHAHEQLDSRWAALGGLLADGGSTGEQPAGSDPADDGRHPGADPYKRS